jgi:hypothetical protein
MRDCFPDHGASPIEPQNIGILSHRACARDAMGERCKRQRTTRGGRSGLRGGSSCHCRGGVNADPITYVASSTMPNAWGSPTDNIFPTNSQYQKCPTCRRSTNYIRKMLDNGDELEPTPLRCACSSDGGRRVYEACLAGQAYAPAIAAVVP